MSSPAERLAVYLEERGFALRGPDGQVTPANPCVDPEERTGSVQFTVEAADLLYQVCSVAHLDRGLEEQIYAQALELGGKGVIELAMLRRILAVTLFEKAAAEGGELALLPSEWRLLLG